MTNPDSAPDRQPASRRLRNQMGRFARLLKASPDIHDEVQYRERNQYLDVIEHGGQPLAVSAFYIKGQTPMLQHDLLPHDKHESVIISLPPPIESDEFVSHKFIRPTSEYGDTVFDDTVGFDSEIDDMPCEIFDITLNVRGECVVFRPTTFRKSFGISSRPAKISAGSMVYRILPAETLDDPKYEAALGPMMTLPSLHSAEKKQLLNVLGTVAPK